MKNTGRVGTVRRLLLGALVVACIGTFVSAHAWAQAEEMMESPASIAQEQVKTEALESSAAYGKNVAASSLEESSQRNLAQGEQDAMVQEEAPELSQQNGGEERAEDALTEPSAKDRVTLGIAAESLRAEATFNPRTTAPSSNNSWFYSDINPYYAGYGLAPKPVYASGGYVVGNCTWYAWGRAGELLGHAPRIGRGNPLDMWNFVKSQKTYATGSTPRLGALCIGISGTGNWHVSVVEAIKNGTAYVSESGYKVASSWWGYDNINFHYGPVDSWMSGNILGYIYILGTNVVPVSDVSTWTINIPNQMYTGSAVTPNPTVKVGNTTLEKDVDYTVSYANNVNKGTATATIRGINGNTGSETVTFSIYAPAHAYASYRTHVQSIGWQGWVADGAMSGTSGQAKRLEGIELKLANAPQEGGIEYRTHVQTYGWQGWKRDGAMSGTEGQAKRLEAIEIRLTGKMAENYDVWYRVHAQSYGWMGWAKNGQRSGTATLAKRLEGIQIVIVEKGSDAPGATYKGISQATSQAYVTRQVAYRTHVQTFGWQDWSYDGTMSGTEGQAKRLEGINIKLSDPLYGGGIEYRTHVQTYGWQGWKRDGDMSGTSGEAKRLEAIEIRLTGEMEKHYDIWYRVHAQTFGWMGWASNGARAGTAGYSKRLEGIEIRLLPKGSTAPGSTTNPFRQAA